MNIETFPAPPIEGNPYDEDITGFHKGATIKIEGKSLTLSVVECHSGIGTSYELSVDAGERGKRGIATVFISDDGELIVNEHTEL